MKSFANVEQNVMPIIGECLVNITAAADHIDPLKVTVVTANMYIKPMWQDCAQLVRDHKTGNCIPEEYGSKQASKGKPTHDRKVIDSTAL